MRSLKFWKKEQPTKNSHFFQLITEILEDKKEYRCKIEGIHKKYDIIRF